MMKSLQELILIYDEAACRDLEKLEALRDVLKSTSPDAVRSLADARIFIELVRRFRAASARADKLKGDNYPDLMNALLSVGEDGVYADPLRFLFELIQNVDDCDFPSPDDCRLDMHFDWDRGKITLTYNEVGFTPFNVFAITGIAEAAKNISDQKREIGEKGIGFKSVFGVADQVSIHSGWFAFTLTKENFTIPVLEEKCTDFVQGTQMTLSVGGKAKELYQRIRDRYCKKESIFASNPLLFLNKLTYLKIYYDSVRSIEFAVSKKPLPQDASLLREDNIALSVKLHDGSLGDGRIVLSEPVSEQISCTRYTYPMQYSKEAYQSRYGKNTALGSSGAHPMLLQVVLPNPEYIQEISQGTLYSYFPTQLKLSVPLACHVPFKLDASREFVDPQKENIWFQESVSAFSRLLSQALMDWRSVVREQIVHYLPAEQDSLFLPNNGKELCLKKQPVFHGRHILSMPLFFCADQAYHTSSEVFCFDPEEAIADPEQVSKWLRYPKALFYAPADIKPGKYGIQTVRNVLPRLFRTALAQPVLTARVLEYLDSAGFSYCEEDLPEGTMDFPVEQIQELTRHDALFQMLRDYAIRQIKNNKRPGFSATGVAPTALSSVMYDGFDLGETTQTVEKYMTYCRSQCILLNMEEASYLPCHNAVVLSRQNAISSFAAFCHDMDPRDSFAIRMQMREASERLNRSVENPVGTAEEYLRTLRDNRLFVKEALGKRGYDSYIQLIQRSGTEKSRFLQELLQNADDCEYDSGVIPTFHLELKDGKAITEYNEKGFDRRHIRAITAVGESTKNRLLDGDIRTIGEKGVGFKTVFAVASEVQIHSGDYHFRLTDREPTIPKTLPDSGVVHGTRMEIALKDRASLPPLKERDVLDLCLCLRRLRRLEIGAHSVTIQDEAERRIVTVDKHSYSFRRYTHRFTIENDAALREVQNGSREKTPEQVIQCYVPERAGHTEFRLYHGLPTKHRLRIPMAIDAPFELTTSREEIETDYAAWNQAVRREMFRSILEVMDARKGTERANVLQFSRFVPRRQGVATVYINDISDSEFLNAYPFLEELKKRPILPTLDPERFSVPEQNTAYRYPDAAMQLFRLFSDQDFGKLRGSAVLDLDGTEYDSVLNALGCQPAPFSMVFPILAEHAETFVDEEDFRAKLYAYLQSEALPEYQGQLQALSIIPVYGRTPGSTRYVSWEEDRIFIKTGAVVSTADYFILNQNLLSKSACEHIMGVNINEMSSAWEGDKYRERLTRELRSIDAAAVYHFLLDEFQSGRLERYKALGILLEQKEIIPLKNQLGEIDDSPKYLCDQPVGYFPTEMLQRLTVHEECKRFADFIRCDKLSGIHYEDIQYAAPLTGDDVESLQDEYFINSDELLRGFYRDGLLSDDLLHEYSLEYLSMSGSREDDDLDTEFPEAPVYDLERIRAHARALWRSAPKIITVEEKRSVQKAEAPNGNRFPLDSEQARRAALSAYAPASAHGKCFCQMCRRVKDNSFIEVNNIELSPKYFFPELRIALCLECSKRFESLRNNTTLRERFIESIRSAKHNGMGKLDVAIGSETITFTAAHLVEIQEILRQAGDK